MAHLESAAKFLLIGKETEAPREYWSLSAATYQGTIEIGIISSGLGIAPRAIVSDAARRIAVGYDTWVSFVEPIVPTILRTLRLEGAFYEFISVDDAEEVVVVHELGAVRTTLSGNVKWSVSTDVVEEFLLQEPGGLVLRPMDGRAVTVSLATGAALAATT
jgi:hypothetical protein